ncbi:MAG: AAA family ATPase, partial [Desulfovibrionaceae bacterium]|nr:AAA family ATPase [Desulfovibrionaceae bacterium]
MEEIRRDLYLKRLTDRRENGLIKVITGIRRCGKSYLLFRLYWRYLTESGVDPSRIIAVALDDDDFEELRDRKKLNAYIRERLT